MNKEELKSLVKKYFNLTEIDNNPVNKEEVKEESFAVAHLADGTEITNKAPGDFAVGDTLYVITGEGEEVLAPSGEHTSSSGIVITVDEEGKITGVKRPDEAGEGSLEEMSAEEVTEETEKTEMAEHGDEEEVMDEVSEEEVAMEEHDVKEAIVEAIAEVVAPQLEEMKEKLSSCMDKLAEHEEKMKDYMSKESATPSVTESKFSKGLFNKQPEVWNFESKNYKQKQYEEVLSRNN